MDTSLQQRIQSADLTRTENASPTIFSTTVSRCTS